MVDGDTEIQNASDDAAKRAGNCRKTIHQLARSVMKSFDIITV